jgi:hypothetical protein
MFNDLSLSNDFKQNEYVLKHFFLFKDKPNKPVEVFDENDTFTGVNPDDMRMPLEIKYV